MENIKIQKSLFDKLGLLVIGLMLVIFIYGGLSLAKLQKQNETFNQKQIALEGKIILLEEQLIDTTNSLVKLSDDYQVVSSNLNKNNSDLAYYKKLTLNLQKQNEVNAVIATTPATQPADQEIKLETPKTVVQKVYVKEKPKYEASVIVQGVGSYVVEVKSGDNAFSILKRAADANGFNLVYQTFDFGVFVTSIGGISPAGNQYWAFYYNGNFSQVGASDQSISSDDTTFWQLESF